MVNRFHSIEGRNALVVCFVLVVTTIVLALLWSPMPTQAGPTLPDREPPSAPDDNDDDDDGGTRPLMTSIVLQVQPPQGGLWTVVQWEDSGGNWHDVEGWRGELGTSGTRVWQVVSKDFGTGPFRWALFQGQDGRLVTASQSFRLPSKANEVVRVEVSLGP